MKALLVGVAAFQLIIATVFAGEAIEHKTYKLLRSGVLASGDSVEVANFGYHEDLKPTVAAQELNHANCQTAAKFFTELTGQEHWCEESSIIEFESFQ